MPIIAEMKGTANYVDLVDGISVREVTDDATGISSREVIDWKASAGGANLRPRITLRDDKGEVLTLTNGLEARYFMSAGAILSVDNGAAIQAGDVLARIPRESSKTRDITGGLPRVAELFEARKPKDFAVIAEAEGRVEFANDYKAKRRIRVVPVEGDGEPVEYLLPKGRRWRSMRVTSSARATSSRRQPVPHDILADSRCRAAGGLSGQGNPGRLSPAGREDQRQAHRGDCSPDAAEGRGHRCRRQHLPDRRAESTARNSRVECVARGRRACGRRLRIRCLLGITKASLQTRSFISPLRSRKRPASDRGCGQRASGYAGWPEENVIVGRLIPAGTGSVMKRLRRIAADRDKVIMEERAAAARRWKDVRGQKASPRGRGRAEPRPEGRFPAIGRVVKNYANWRLALKTA